MGSARPSGRRRILLVCCLLLTAGAIGPATAGTVVAGDASDTPTLSPEQVSSVDAPVGPHGAPAGETPAATDDSRPRQVEGCGRTIDPFVGIFNSNIDGVPGIVRNRVENSTVHLLVTGTAGGNYSMETNNESQVVSYSTGVPQNPSLLVRTDCETFREILAAENPNQAFQDAYNDEQIEMVGIGAINWLFFTAADLLNEPGTVAIILVLFILLILLLYVLYRRITLHYRGGEDEPPGEEGGPPAGEGGQPPAAGPDGQPANDAPPGQRQAGGPGGQHPGGQQPRSGPGGQQPPEGAPGDTQPPGGGPGGQQPPEGGPGGQQPGGGSGGVEAGAPEHQPPREPGEESAGSGEGSRHGDRSESGGDGGDSGEE